MKHLVALSALSISPVLCATDNCSFDQENQSRVIVAIGARFPGGKVDLEKHEIAWSDPRVGATTFGYGGCADLGSVVSRSTNLPQPRTEEEVFAVARELGMQFWSNAEVAANSATEAVSRAIERSEYVVDKEPGLTTFRIKDPNYVELYVEHEYAGGVDRVSIAWHGSF